MKIKAVILGASGYTGAEILRFALLHPNIEITALSAESNAGMQMQNVFPHLYGVDLPILQKIDAIDFNNVEAVFCALPHGTTQKVIAQLYQTHESLKIIDLSADFRLSNVDEYQRWYGDIHHAKQIQQYATYGVTELNRDAIKVSRLVANPGCYPTTAQLPLLPLLREGFISADDIIIDSKSGVTGAGRAPKQAMLYAEIAESFNAYGLDGHRHSAEMQEQFDRAVKGSSQSVQFHFVPHLVPTKRGILSTIHCKSNDDCSVKKMREYLTDYYKNDAFVHIMPESVSAPKTADVLGSNQCRIALYSSPIEGRVLIVSVIDNLVKGASGQAIQNFNVMFGLPETQGLQNLPIFP